MARWPISLDLQGGVHRFSELHRKVGGVSEKMLAQTLKWLETDGLMQRQAYATVPPHVEYRLTPLGEQIAPHVQALADWIEVNLPRIMAARRDIGIPSAEAETAVGPTD